MKKTSRTSTRDNSKSGFGKMIRATVGRQKKVWPMSLMIINKMQVVSFQQIQKLDDRFNKVYDDGDEGVDEDDDVS